jgi:hypothetical protein
MHNFYHRSLHLIIFASEQIIYANNKGKFSLKKI